MSLRPAATLHTLPRTQVPFIVRVVRALQHFAFSSQRLWTGSLSQRRSRPSGLEDRAWTAAGIPPTSEASGRGRAALDSRGGERPARGPYAVGVMWSGPAEAGGVSELHIGPSRMG